VHYPDQLTQQWVTVIDEWIGTFGVALPAPGSTATD
jgi:hypothetical protein